MRNDPDDIAALASRLAQERGNGVEPMSSPSGGREARLRALFALIYLEAGEAEPDHAKLERLVAALKTLGLTIRPLETRF
jgi:hypothetical protein